MALDSGTVFDGELTVYPSSTRTSAGFFTVVEAAALHWAFQVTVTGHTSGNIDFDFDGSLDGTNWGHITVATKHPGGLTINENITVLYYADTRPCRYVRAHIVSMPSGPTITCTTGSM